MESVENKSDPQLEINNTTNRLEQTVNKEKEHLQVYLRIRPFTASEIEHGESQDCMVIEQPDTILLKPQAFPLSTRLSNDRSMSLVGQRFRFSKVYGPETTQQELFQGTVQDLVKDVLDGGHSLLFTYGVTNAGKTFTFLGPDEDAGILPRSLQVIFSSIEQQVFNGMSIKPHRCREFTSLTQEQQAEEATFKRNLMKQLKERDKCNFSILNSTCNTSLDGVSEDKISLQVDTNTKFSVWVSFCEIYNENIHDLLEVAPSCAPRRPMLRLSEDVKGSTFVKDLRWVQVNSAEEAYTVMKLGKRNQSFSSTKLNQLSSRSHSIFSIRILKIYNAGTPRVQTVGELCLCDLAGSERCTKTQNQGERLKEAGNINSSLLILGKCINMMRQNQQTKLLQHIPFRESKLTRYLQRFFCTQGKARMIVNINQCASMHDETLNVLKFSAVAQQVMVLSNPPLPFATRISAFNHHDPKAPGQSMGSSLSGWETSLEDVEELLGEETSQMEETIDEDDDDEEILVSKKRYQQQEMLVNQLQIKLKKEQANNMLMETKIREEVCCEFTSLYSKMQSNFDSRLAREMAIVEDRAEKRLNIFKKLIDKMVTESSGQQGQSMENSLAEMQRVIEAADVGQADEPSEDLVSNRCKGVSCVLNDEEKANLRLQLQEKTSYVKQLEKQVSELRRLTEDPLLVQEDQSQEKQAPPAPLTEQNKSTETLLAELEYQTNLKEKVLISLEKERAVNFTKFTELKQKEEHILKTLTQQRTDKEEALAALDFERSAREQLIADLEREKKGKDDALLLLQTQANEVSRLKKELEHKVTELTAKLTMPESLVAGEPRKLGDASIGVQDRRESSRKTDETISQVLTLKKHDECLGLMPLVLSHQQRRQDSCKDLKETLCTRCNEKLQGEELNSPMELEDENGSFLLKKREDDDSENASQAKLHIMEKSLKDKEEELGRAHQEGQTQKRDLEKLRELLDVASEAIAHKDIKLGEKTGEISRLTEKNNLDCKKLQSLTLGVQRNEEETSDLREKLADYKKQIQQVQKEIASMRDQEKVLTLKFSEAEKIKKQLQMDLANRDWTIKQQKEQLSNSKSDESVKLHQKACDDLKDKERVLEEMRSTLIEQEETQEQMDQILVEKENLVQELSSELEKVRAILLRRGGSIDEGRSEELVLAKRELNKAQETIKLSDEKQRSEKKRWQEEKLSLISQVQEAEKKRNQEMRKFAEDREKHLRQNGHLESELAKMEQLMETWRKERDTLVAALEVKLKELLRSHEEKDQRIQMLQRRKVSTPPKVKSVVDPGERSIENQKSGTQRNSRPSSSTSYPSVLDSSEISTENGRTSRFPRPEMEISFSPLQPNRVELRRQGEEGRVTVKISSATRKRKSGEMEKSHIFRRSKRRPTNKEEVEAENRVNTMTKPKPKLKVHHEEVTSPNGCSDSSIKDGTLQRIGDFLQSSPTLFGSTAKKVMSLINSKGDVDSLAFTGSSSSLNLKAHKKKKTSRLEISSPMELPSQPIFGLQSQEKQSDYSIKRRLRPRFGK